MQLVPTSVVKAGGELGRVMVVTAALPVAVVAAVVEGRENTASAILSTAANVGQTVGELVAQEAPRVVVNMMLGEVGAVLYTALKSGSGGEGCSCDVA